MDNVAFTIFGKEIYWYGIIIAVGLILGVVIGVYEAKRKGYRSEMVLDFILLAVPLCIICARLYYVIFQWDNYVTEPIRMLYIWEGGLAIYGGVIGGAIAAILFYRWRRIAIGDMLDIAAPGLIIGQAIGRWGNFMNQEAFGTAVSNPAWQHFPWAVYIDPGKTIDGTFFPAGYYHATFFYESMWNLIVFAILLLVRKKIKVRGGVFAMYVVLYGFGRFWIEQMRTDSLMWGSIRVSEGLSELLFFGGIAYLVYMHFTRRNYFPYSGYYNLGLTEAQIDGFKGKNKLMNAQLDLNKAKWYAGLVRDNDITSPHYRAVREKADKLAEKADSLFEELGEDNARVKAARKKADAMTQKADTLYARYNSKGRLKLAMEEAEKAEKEFSELSESDPDSTEALAAQEKLDAANLLVEKIRDIIAEDEKAREDLLEKEELHVEALEEKVRQIKEELGLAEEKKAEEAKEEEPETEETDDKAKEVTSKGKSKSAESVKKDSKKDDGKEAEEKPKKPEKNKKDQKSNHGK